ncbi:MAG TPA: hypothetical protein VFU31_10345 [Candidatus Binatia bacterium]|nr:hypothetical protein [Candidatus Binatia bacterium]
MTELARPTLGSTGAVLLAVLAISCSSVQEQAQIPKTAATQPPSAAKSDEPGREETKKTKTKAVEVEAVISSVGQRTITFQTEKMGKIREEVVGVDEKTNIEKSGNKVKLRDLQESDKALINYEPDAYTPAIAIKVIGKGKIQKLGGSD